MRVIRMVGLAAALACTPCARAETVFKLYCAGAKVQIDDRSFVDMKKAFGPDVCNFGDFTTREQAQNHSKVFGGEGAKCSCR